MHSFHQSFFINIKTIPLSHLQHVISLGLSARVIAPNTEPLLPFVFKFSAFFGETKTIYTLPSPSRQNHGDAVADQKVSAVAGAGAMISS